MTTCPDCERTREMLLELLKKHTAPLVYDRHKGPGVTIEDLIELLSDTMEEMQREIDDAW